VTQVDVAPLDEGWFIIIGRGSDGYFWFRTASCESTCTFEPWRSTGGFGWDANLGDGGDYGCVDMAVIGADRAVWWTELCAWEGALGWHSLGGSVTDISYRGDNVYAVDPWNRLWLRRHAGGVFAAGWTDLGGYVRWPVDLLIGSPFAVAAVGGDHAMWVYKEGVGWSKPSAPTGVGDLRPQWGTTGNVLMIQGSLDPKRCTSMASGAPGCTALGGKVTSLAAVEDLAVGIGTDGKTYYQILGKGWALLV
jgi:hypothetical protein